LATSGSTDWTRTRDEIIERALRIIGKLGSGQRASAAMTSEGSEALNAMVKSWQSENVFLWTTEWISTTMATASSEVTGTDSAVYTCIRDHTSGNTNKPITGADYETYWKERGSTGGVWVTSTSYSSIGDFDVASDTISIEKAFIRYNEDDYDLEIIDKFRFMNIPDKADEGRPTHLWLDRQLTPHIYLWPIPDETTYVLHYKRIRLIEDFDASGNNPDFPIRWINALTYGLAHHLSHEYQLPLQERLALKAEAKEFLDIAQSMETEVSEDNFITGAFD
jgi:hypothetical protein